MLVRYGARMCRLCRHALGVGRNSLRNILRTARELLAGPEQVVGAMNGDIQAAGKLLAELREAYRGLPQHIQVHVAYLLRESTLQTQNGDKRAS